MLYLSNHLRRLSRHSLTTLKFSASSNKPQGDSQKVYLNEQSIQRKIKEMKEKTQHISSDPKAAKKTKDFMPVFTIPQVNEKVNAFRKETGTEDLFAFSDITLEEKPTVIQITGYDTEFIQVDNFQYPPSVILTPNQIMNWQVQSPEMLRIENFAILKILQPIPDYVIIGVPDSSVIGVQLRNKLREIHPNMDILDLFEAISQFNTVADNDKSCIAFMMSR